MKEKWDVFISHASEDKKQVVEPLVRELTQYGIRVWYDEFELSIGDSLTRTIDKGLAFSKYGVIVLSPSFLKKDWPEYELKGLLAREIGGTKVILPIWHGIEKTDLLMYSPTITDKYAINTNSKSIGQIALLLIDVIRPDLSKKIHQKKAFESIIASSDITYEKSSSILLPPKRHEKLSDDLIRRIRFIRAALLSVKPHSMEYWVDGFMRDLHPSREVKVWEQISLCYLEVLQMLELDSSQRKIAFFVIFGLISAYDEKNLQKQTKSLPEGSFNIIKNVVSSKIPPYDFKEELHEDIHDFSDREKLLREAYGYEDYTN